MPASGVAVAVNQAYGLGSVETNGDWRLHLAAHAWQAPVRGVRDRLLPINP